MRKAQRDKDVCAQKLKEEQLKHAESAATYAAQIKTAEEAKGDLESRVQDLLKQNEILHSQGEEVCSIRIFSFFCATIVACVAKPQTGTC